MSGEWLSYPWLASCEDEVGGLDELSHDGHEDELLWLSMFEEALGEDLEGRAASAGCESGEVDQAPWPASAAADEALTFPLTGVAIEGGDAEQAGGLAPVHRAQLGHADHQGRRHDRTHARQAEKQAEAS